MSKCMLALNRIRKVLGSCLGSVWLFWFVWFGLLFCGYSGSTALSPSCQPGYTGSKIRCLLHTANLYILEPDFVNLLNCSHVRRKAIFFWSKEKLFQALLKYIPKNKTYSLCSVIVNVWRGTPMHQQQAESGIAIPTLKSRFWESLVNRTVVCFVARVNLQTTLASALSPLGSWLPSFLDQLPSSASERKDVNHKWNLGNSEVAYTSN